MQQLKTCEHCKTTFGRGKWRGNLAKQKYCSRRCYHAVIGNQDGVVLFNAKVQRGADNECWPWMGARVPAGGYGRLRFQKRNIAAHRVAYMLCYGNIPAGLDVMHSCDNPPCCNPAHLKAATTLENMQDAKRKGRMNHKYTPIEKLLRPHLSRRLRRA